MSDQISLTGLRVRGFHGVYDHERRNGQDFVVDAVLDTDTSVAAKSDDVTDTVHYGELAEQLANVVAGPPVNLLETLASQLMEVCLSYPLVVAAKVTVHKPQAPIQRHFTDVSVTIHRTRFAGAQDGRGQARD
jgi:dihydroneopterin aldolase